MASGGARWLRAWRRVARRRAPASEPGDVIVEFNGKPVTDRDALVRMVVETKPGASVPLKVVRDKQERSLTVTVEELDLEAESHPRRR